jgi:hypothetical protein
LATSLRTPESIQKLQTALHAKAKESPDFRFYALYDKVYRKDILAFAYACCKANGGAAGVDRQRFEDIEAYGVERWLDELSHDRKRTTNPPIKRGRFVMDSFYGRRVWSWSSSSWRSRGSAVGCFVPEKRDGTKRVLSQSWNGFEHAGPASEEAVWRAAVE